MPGPYRGGNERSCNRGERAGRDEPVHYEPRNRSFIPLQ